MEKNISKSLYWTPRILSIVFIFFLALMSLDIFEGNYGFWGTIVGLFMHNIPAMILLIVYPGRNFIPYNDFDEYS